LALVKKNLKKGIDITASLCYNNIIKRRFDNMQVNENRLDTILQSFVESFNDCACCPLTFDCERDNKGVDCYDCAELLKKWLIGE
jgi:hypothetical protein